MYSTGGLDDALGSIITSCQENQIPVVFALKRQLLGKVLLKKVPVSIVGIFNYDGAQVSIVQYSVAKQGGLYEFVIDRRSYTHNLSSCEIKA